MRRVGRRAWVIVVAAAAVVVVALVSSCGGSSSSSSSQTPEQWANSLCTAANTYVNSLKSLGTKAKNGGLSKDSIDSLVSDAKSSTETFANDLKAVGKPPTTDSKTKSVLEALQSELSNDADAIQNAVKNVSSLSDVLSAVPVITSTVSSAGTQIRNAYDQIQQIDPKGQVQQAFKSAPACSGLVGSS